MPDLRELFEEREAAERFKQRDAAYELFEHTYNSVDTQTNTLDLAYRPNNIEGVNIGIDAEIRKIVVNQVRRVVNHFAAMFSHRPRVFVLATDPNTERAEWQTEYVNFVSQRSNLDAKHAQQAHYLSLRGDAVFGVDWNPTEGTEPGILIRTYDPRHCYPMFSPHDLGACEDMLIAVRVNPDWARRNFGVTGLNPWKPAHVYYYWTTEEFHVQVEDQYVPHLHRTHNLNMCPFRWVFGDASGLMAQADCREVPKLQEVYNECLLLSIDAIRKQVDPAYYVTNMTKDVHPEPGEASALPEGASIGVWPVEADPQIIMGVMDHLEQSIQSTTGVSPISVQGQAKGSIVTGTAVRHQVEAADARAETRKVLVESTYARLAEMVLRVANTQYPEEMIRFMSRNGVRQQQGKEFERFSICGAEYSDFVASTPEMRFQIALQGLGHLWDLEYAVGNVLNLPGTNPQEMVQRIGRYQVQQAKMAAEAQRVAQEATQQAPGGQESPAAGPPQGGQAPSVGPGLQRPQRGSPPPPQALRQLLAGMTGRYNGTGPRQ